MLVLWLCSFVKRWKRADFRHSQICFFWNSDVMAPNPRGAAFFPRNTLQSYWAKFLNKTFSGYGVARPQNVTRYPGRVSRKIWAVLSQHTSLRSFRLNRVIDHPVSSRHPTDSTQEFLDYIFIPAWQDSPSSAPLSFYFFLFLFLVW